LKYPFWPLATIVILHRLPESMFLIAAIEEISFNELLQGRKSGAVRKGRERGFWNQGSNSTNGVLRLGNYYKLIRAVVVWQFRQCLFLPELFLSFIDIPLNIFQGIAILNVSALVLYWASGWNRMRHSCAKRLLSYFNGWHCKCGLVSFVMAEGCTGALTPVTAEHFLQHVTHVGSLCPPLMYSL